jgi:DMSO/TMAO reductase YedYZ heme-binding membrane subunit
VTRSRSFDWKVAAATLIAGVACGYLLVRVALPVSHDRYFPWIVGRACGLGAYVMLFFLVTLGMWLRHPWRHRFAWLHAETQLRLHSVAGMACVVLVGGHLVSLALDKWAGVGWIGTVVPLKATYRPRPVAVGVLAFYALLAVILTARFGGRLVGRRWLTVHRLALPTLAMVWFHGVLAGTDTPRLRWFYAVTGLFVAVLAATRWFGRATQQRTTLHGAAASIRAPRGAAGVLTGSGTARHRGGAR